MNRIIKNASWIIIGRILQALLNIVVTMVTARYLGPSNYGLITYASSLVTFIVPLVQLGFSYVLVQELVDAPEQSGCTIGTATLLTTLSSMLGVLGVWAFTTIVNRNEQDTIFVSVVYSISLFFHMTEMIQYWYQAQLLSKYVSIVSLIARVVVSIYKIYIVISGKSIYWFAIVNSIDYALISFFLFAIYFSKGGKRLSFSINTAKRLMSKSKYFIVAGMMVSIFSQTDKIMLKIMIGDEASGIYSVAVACVGMSSFVFSAVIDSFRPIIFENKKKSKDLYKKNTIVLYTIVIYMALAQSVVLSIFAKPVINLLYGLEYWAAVSVLRIVTWYSTFSYLGAARTIWFISEDKDQYVWITNLAGAIINVIGNFLLIPAYGVYGAALASVATQALTNFCLTFFIPSIRENGIWIIEAINPKILIQWLGNRGEN